MLRIQSQRLYTAQLQGIHSQKWFCRGSGLAPIQTAWQSGGLGPVSASPLLSHDTALNLRFLMSKRRWDGVGVTIRTHPSHLQCSRKEGHFVNYCDRERENNEVILGSRVDRGQRWT